MQLNSGHCFLLSGHKIVTTSFPGIINELCLNHDPFPYLLCGYEQVAWLLYPTDTLFFKQENNNTHSNVGAVAEIHLGNRYETIASVH